MTAIVYIAGPYAGPTQEAIAENVRRATEIGRLAVTLGACPIVPHVLGVSGLYGDPTEADGGTTRANALRCGVTMAGALGQLRGFFWAIARDDGSLSSGTSLEINAFVQGAFDFGVGTAAAGQACLVMPWSAWEEEIREPWHGQCRIHLLGAKR